MIYIGIVNLVLKVTVDIGIQMILRHNLLTLHFSRGLLEGSGIEPNYTIIISFHFFIPFNVVNLG